jgi:50S ribosomal subunit-associated GTPase HflX
MLAGKVDETIQKITSSFEKVKQILHELKAKFHTKVNKINNADLLKTNADLRCKQTKDTDFNYYQLIWLLLPPFFFFFNYLLDHDELFIACACSV